MDEESTGVRDEIGFLTIHQGYADLFFPGTSVLHTRARYLLFVPRLFEDLAPATGPVAQRALQEKERVLAGRMRNQPGEDHPDRRGTTGGVKFPKPSAQPPSTRSEGQTSEPPSLMSTSDGHLVLKEQNV